MCSSLVSRKGNQEHDPAGCQVCFSRPSSRPAWHCGNNLRTSLPRRSFVGSTMKSRSSSKRVFTFRRNLRRRNLSTRKMWITRFKIFSRADGSGRIKTLLRRSRVHTPPRKGQSTHRTLFNLNEATVKRQTTYEDLHMLKFGKHGLNPILVSNAEREKN